MARLRHSRFIDFNTGFVHKPPMALQNSLPPREKQSPQEMLDLFECRVDVWKFGPAVEMLKAMDVADLESSVWRHGGYALLDVTCSYFEMIGKILNPDSRTVGHGRAGFQLGLLRCLS